MTIILEERKFIWEDAELREFREMWEQGDSVNKMAKRFRCKEIDIAMLVLDQAEKKLIRSRPAGLIGGVNQ
ncbi:hypothetical protein [Carnobacterium jeotgali]|uniref:hypothetical protein n=1 Tax=Carnobacterium jeotgali TaxID=545534 RepID=UPI00068C7D4C|nr:hypothetical protein [Carnobacterium jeotgali]